MKRFGQQAHYGKGQPSQASRSASMLAMLASARDIAHWTPEALRRMYGGTLKDCEYALTIETQRRAR